MGSIRKREDTGLLFIDFRYRSIRCREQTALTDTDVNRRKVQKVLDRIEAEIASGTFDYRRFFPGSKNAEKFDEATPQLAVSQVTQTVAGAIVQGLGQVNAGVAGTPLFRDFAETWYAEKEVEWRRSHKINIRADLDGRITPQWGIGRSAESQNQTYLATVLSSPKYRHGAKQQCCPTVASTE